MTGRAEFIPRYRYGFSFLFYQFWLVLARGAYRVARGRWTLVEEECARRIASSFRETAGETVGLTFGYGLLIGTIVGQFGFDQLSYFVIAQAFVGKVLLAFLVPFAIANFVIVRGIVALTSDIVSMKVSQEIEVLEITGEHPANVIFVPRALALTIAAPGLAVIGFYSAFGGFFVAAQIFTAAALEEVWRVFSATVTRDMFVESLGKITLIAFLMAMGGAYQAFRQADASTVSIGKMTTKSVAEAMVFITIINMGFAILSGS